MNRFASETEEADRLVNKLTAERDVLRHRLDALDKSRRSSEEDEDGTMNLRQENASLRTELFNIREDIQKSQVSCLLRNQFVSSPNRVLQFLACLGPWKGTKKPSMSMYPWLLEILCSPGPQNESRSVLEFCETTQQKNKELQQALV